MEQVNSNGSKWSCGSATGYYSNSQHTDATTAAYHSTAVHRRSSNELTAVACGDLLLSPDRERFGHKRCVDMLVKPLFQAIKRHPRKQGLQTSHFWPEWKKSLQYVLPIDNGGPLQFIPLKSVPCCKYIPCCVLPSQKYFGVTCMIKKSTHQVLFSLKNSDATGLQVIATHLCFTDIRTLVNHQRALKTHLML